MEEFSDLKKLQACIHVRTVPILLLIQFNCFFAFSQHAEVLQSMSTGNVLSKDSIEYSTSFFEDLISNGDFATYDSACLAVHSLTQPCPDPLQQGCINAWLPSHGSPEFSMPDHAVRIGSVKSNGYSWGEGIYQVLTHQVDSGNSYILFLEYQGDSLSDSSFLDIQLTNQEFHSGTCFEMLPQPGWHIDGSPLTAMQNGKNAVLIFKAVKTFRKIWFTHRNESTSVSWIAIRKIHLFRMDNLSQREIIDLIEFMSASGYPRLQLFLSENCFDENLHSTFTTIPCQQIDSKK